MTRKATEMNNKLEALYQNNIASVLAEIGSQLSNIFSGLKNEKVL